MDAAGASEFAIALRRCREPDGLLGGAIAIARGGGRHVDAGAVRRELDLLADGAAARASRQDTVALVEAINHELFTEAGFEGNSGALGEPENSFIDAVLQRRRGIPISLSVVYMEIARRIGLRCDGIGFPGHFIVRCGAPGEEFFVDPFNQGVRVDRGELLAALAQHRGGGASPESWLAAVTPVQVLQRMLYNLYSVYRHRGSGGELHGVIDQLLCIEPWNVDLIGERGLLRYRMNDVPGAVRDLEQYVEHRSQPGPEGPPRGLEIALRALTDLHHRIDPLTGGRHDDQ